MTCPRCQQDNPTHARFCLGCGARLSLACGACGAELPGGARFCLQCGQAIAGSPAAPVRSPAPETYTPRHLAEKILTSKSALEGERKQVTVLFADLKGSMELLADRDPEEARKLLDPVLERMMAAVHRYEGTVNQVMGDGIMALFGAPVAHEDHAVRACYSALDMQAAIRRYAEEARRRHGVVLQVRVGLNSGEVVVRAIGSDLRMDYTAVGQTTHLAARMEQLAKPDTTLLTADVLRLAEGLVAVAPLSPVPVKGLEAPVEVYELTGAGPRRSRLHAAAGRGLTRFVGRAGELDQLSEALGRAGHGQGQIVAIVGEPGVGKSRLVWEVTHSHRVQGWLVLQAGSVSYGKATAYLPVIDLLKGYVAIEDRDGPRAVQEKLTGKLLTLDRALEGSLPALLSLLDVPADDSQWAALDPTQRRRQTLDAVKRLLLRESQVQPLLVVFEDLHWIDSETQALLDALVESLPAARVLLLVNYRPEYQHPWGSRSYYTQLRLDPLPHDHAAELLGALVGSDSGLDPLKRVLIARTEGNPFFLEESVRSLVETGSLAGERGAYRLARPLPTIQIPATVQAVLAARIDRLLPADRALLQAASVVGKAVPLVLLQAIAEPGEAELSAAIGRLQAAEFLYETRIFPDVEYTFKHALTHEVAYGSLLLERRRVLHGRIVEALEALYPDRLAEQVEQLAHHALRGEVWDKALVYCRQAGAKAMTCSANREAVVCFEQALAALEQLPERRDRREQAIDLRFELRQALVPLGEVGRILDYLREAETMAEALGDQRRLARSSSLMISCYRARGEYDRAIEAGQRALPVAEALGDFAMQVVANYALGLLYREQGNYRRAIDALKWTAASVQGSLVREQFGLGDYPAVGARGGLAWSLAEIGEFAEGTTYGEEAIRIAEEVNHPYSLGVAYFDLGGLYLRRGHLREAISILERGLGLCKAGDLPGLFLTVASRLGAAYILAGRVTDALPLLEQVELQAVSKGLMDEGSLQGVWLSEAYLVADRIEDASQRAERALRLSLDQRNLGLQAWTLRLLGEIAAHRDPPEVEQAEAHYQQACALAEELGMRPLVAHCHLGLGKLYRRTDEAAKAQEHLTTAGTMYREMDMGLWLEQAEAEAALGPPHGNSP